MPRARWATPRSIQHMKCGLIKHSSYSVTATVCSTCLDRGLEGMENWRDIDTQLPVSEFRQSQKENYDREEEEKELDRVLQGQEKTLEGSTKATNLDEESTEGNAETGGEGSKGSAEFGEQEGFRYNTTEQGNEESKSTALSDPADNILVQILYNLHDVLAERIDPVYDLRALPQKQQYKFMRVTQEVSEELGMDVNLTPLQEFGLMYGMMHLNMLRAARTKRKVDSVHDVEPETYDQSPPADTFYDTDNV